MLTIYLLVKLYHDIQENRGSYYEIFGSYSKNMTFSQASLVIRELESNNIESLREWIDLIARTLESQHIQEALRKALINRLNLEPNSINSGKEFHSMLIRNFRGLMSKESHQEGEAKEKIDSLLNLPMKSLISWLDFIDGREEGDISFHTYHGTKGEEYQNAAIIMEHDFGRNNKNKFKHYFEKLQMSESEKAGSLNDPAELKKHTNTQNLLYVACSRAIKNLWILYIDDISDIKTGIESIFDQVYPWKTEESN